jgi:NAD(P)-dependent dehydrogenase (short-subunit alcohol dehydrogenase family)
MGALEGKVALVAGGGTGIGRAVALCFAREGARVAVFGRRPEPLHEVAQAIDAAGGVGHAEAGDVGVEVDVARLVSETRRLWGGVDVLVNSAAVRLNAPLEKVTADDFAEVLRINLVGAFVLTKMVAGTTSPSAAGDPSSTSAPRSARSRCATSRPTSPPRAASTRWPGPRRSSWSGPASG